MKPGVRVLVPFGKLSKVGVLLNIIPVDEARINLQRLKQVSQVLDTEPLLSKRDLQLLQWASRYYHHPIGEVVASAFPVALRQGKSASCNYETSYSLSEAGCRFDSAQLKRAPKQKALLTLFQAGNPIMTASEIGSDKAALKALLVKNLLQVHPYAQPTPQTVPVKTLEMVANPEQRQAIDSVISLLGSFSVSLLQGITGSGKTEVYMQIMAEALQRGLQILVLLPEITLTPQLEQRFRRRFSVSIVCSHSKMTDKQRLMAWLKLQQGHAEIMLGTRSALFTPLVRPGLIILDEEHDNSFKQQEGFRFSARDVAISRAKMLNIPVLLGSATPSLESLFNASRQRYRLLELSSRAGDAVAPVFQILDIRNIPLQDGLSAPLIATMQTTLARGQQVLLFLNRRGYAPVQICHGCGWVARCPQCDANLVIHAEIRRLRCHHCASEQALTTHCPACKTGELQALGMGTERIEQALAALFPGQHLIRLDKDTTQRRGSLERYLEQINSGQADIILGTQMLAKGHHFPNVTLVAILDVDSGLFSVDYRAGEKLAQLIVQVAGRAGRADKPGRVVLQTRQPLHPLLTTLIDKGYSAFANLALQERKQAGLPPYSSQALLRTHAENAQNPQNFLRAICQLIGQINTGSTQVLGPVSAPMARKAGQFRFQLLLQSPQRKELHQLLDILMPQISQLQEAKKVRWSIDIDPIDLY